LGDAVRRDMTVLFADLKGFSAQTRALEPGARFDLLNEHLALIEPIVIDHGGVVDKFVGDAVMAVFDRRAADAVEAGVAMLRTVAEANARRVAQGTRPIELGIGINTGPLMLGTVGTESRMDTTVISDAVGLAHRVEGLTRPYRSGLLITQSTRRALDEPLRWATRLIDVLSLDEGDAPTPVYEVYEADAPARRLAKRATQAAFERGVQAFHAREVDEAVVQFRLCRALDGGDPATRLYLERCARIEEAFVRV
ncbi:MAG: adenylate/guanylate cyclase domain-containing protein, partial [Myxococcales bacterium]|nr:adenylate/guanylate cyclase domain-containing protein [Myxococcales bacterium]